MLARPPRNVPPFVPASAPAGLRAQTLPEATDPIAPRSTTSSEGLNEAPLPCEDPKEEWGGERESDAVGAASRP